MPAAEQMQAVSRDTPPLIGWIVVYRASGYHTPRLQLAASQHMAETID